MAVAGRWFWRRRRRDVGLDRTRQSRVHIWFDLDRGKARHGRPQHLLTPCIDEAGADLMPICHGLCRRARNQGLTDDGQLGRRTPPPPTLQPGTDLDPLWQPTLTTVVRLVVRALVHVHHAPPHPTRHAVCSNQDRAGMWAWAFAYARAAAWCRRACRLRPRCGRHGQPAQARQTAVLLATRRVRRRWLQLRASNPCLFPAQARPADHQLPPERKMLCASAAPMVGGTHVRLARTPASAVQRLRPPAESVRVHGHPRHDPPHSKPSRPINRLQLPAHDFLNGL